MVYYFIDESGSGFSSEGIAILCCVVIDNPEEARSKIRELKENILHDSRFEKILNELPSYGFHHTNDHIEIKNKFVELLKILTFQAYICFDPSVTRLPFNETYDRLFGRLIIDRLRDDKTKDINICFEQHNNDSKRHQEALAALIASKVDEIAKSDRRPFRGSYIVRHAGKGTEETCLSIADYICGIFANYYEYLAKGKKADKEDLSERVFEDVRNKIRCSHDIKNRKFYSRRNPLQLKP